MNIDLGRLTKAVGIAKKWSGESLIQHVSDPNGPDIPPPLEPADVLADYGDEILRLMNREHKLPLSLDDARNRRLCRICGKAISAPCTYAFGKEYAHNACLEESA